MVVSSEEIVCFIIALLILLFLLSLEHYSQDCEGGRRCSHYWEPPGENEPLSVYIDKLIEGVRNSYNWVSWRLSIVVALISTPVIIYLLFQRLPTLREWIILVVVIFIFSSLASSWLWSKFNYPNGKNIEQALLDLKYKKSLL